MAEETPIAKLRNQLSPYYSLPDMILLMDEKPEMKALVIEQAKRAKATNDRIKELLIEIEGHQTAEKEFVVEKSMLDKFFEENDNDLTGYIKVRVTMHDYDNWNNGDYKGKMHEVVPDLIEKIKTHTIKFAEHLHKYYPNIHKPENYLDVPIKKGERVWMKAFFADDYGNKCTTTELYDEFLNYLKNKTENENYFDPKKCQAGCKVFSGGERRHHKDCIYYKDSLSELLDERNEELNGYKEAYKDNKRLVREIDFILCGKDAAQQASLCDLVSPTKELKQKHDKLVNNEKVYLEVIKANNMMLTEIYSHFGSQFDLQAQENTEHLIKTNKIILE